MRIEVPAASTGVSQTRQNRPIGGRIENDDDTAAAVGDWIEVEWAGILELR